MTEHTDHHDKALKALDKATIIIRTGPQARATLSNLRRLEGLPHISHFGQPLRGRPAFVVGAGPSLDRNGQWLKDAADFGPIITVNTALPSVLRYVDRVDCLVTMEAVPVAHHVEPHLDKVDLVALDVASSAQMWDAVQGRNLAWWCGGTTEVMALVLGTQVPAVLHAGSALTSAVYIAYLWGASEIVLVGCDLAWTGDKAYADGSGWDGLTMERLDDGKLAFSGREDRDAAHRSQGMPPPPRRREPCTVIAYGGEGEVLTGADYLSQINWLADRAREWRGVEIVNATEGGARIDGVEEAGLEWWLGCREDDTFGRMRELIGRGLFHDGRTTTTDEIDAVVAAYLDSADRAERAAKVILERRPVVEMLDAILGEPGAIPSLVAAEMIMLRDQKIPASLRVIAHQRARIRAAEVTRRLVGKKGEGDELQGQAGQ